MVRPVMERHYNSKSLGAVMQAISSNASVSTSNVMHRAILDTTIDASRFGERHARIHAMSTFMLLCTFDEASTAKSQLMSND
jgi:hypothetical protein